MARFFADEGSLAKVAVRSPGPWSHCSLGANSPRSHRYRPGRAREVALHVVHPESAWPRRTHFRAAVHADNARSNGRAASLPPYEPDAPRPSSRTNRTRRRTAPRRRCGRARTPGRCSRRSTAFRRVVKLPLRSGQTGERSNLSFPLPLTLRPVSACAGDVPPRGKQVFERNRQLRVAAREQGNGSTGPAPRNRACSRPTRPEAPAPAG